MAKKQLKLIAGPCVIEDMDILKTTADGLLGICQQLDIDLVFKSSYDKANRSSIKSYRGPGIDKGLKMLAEIKKEFSVKVLSDIHTPEQVSIANEVLDVLQIPAFLARQTDFYIEAGKLNCSINVKKGQFMSAYEMENAITKFKESGGSNISITERGTFFGYGNLVVDFRSIPIIKKFDVPYIFDATHSVQLPAARGGTSGGERQFIKTLTKGQIAAGADGIFMEVHPNVNNAKSDKETQMPLEETKEFLKEILDLFNFINN